MKAGVPKPSSIHSSVSIQYQLARNFDTPAAEILVEGVVEMAEASGRILAETTSAGAACGQPVVARSTTTTIYTRRPRRITQTKRARQQMDPRDALPHARRNTTSKQNALDSKSFPDDVIVSVDSADEKATKYSCRQTDIELQDIVAGPTDSGELSVEEILLNTATDLLSV